MKPKEETISTPLSPEHNLEDSPNKKTNKSEDVQNLNMPKKSNYSKNNKQQLEKIDEI